MYILAAQFNDIAASRSLSPRVSQYATIYASSYNQLSSGMSSGTKIQKAHATNMAGWTVTLP